MIVTPFKILLCLALCLITTVTLRFALGERRDRWFRRSEPKNLVTVRGGIGYHMALGYPVTKEGYAVLAALLALLALEVSAVLLLID